MHISPLIWDQRWSLNNFNLVSLPSFEIEMSFALPVLLPTIAGSRNEDKRFQHQNNLKVGGIMWLKDPEYRLSIPKPINATKSDVETIAQPSLMKTLIVLSRLNSLPGQPACFYWVAVASARARDS